MLNQIYVNILKESWDSKRCVCSSSQPVTLNATDVITQTTSVDCCWSFNKCSLSRWLGSWCSEWRWASRDATCLNSLCGRCFVFLRSINIPTNSGRTRSSTVAEMVRVETDLTSSLVHVKDRTYNPVFIYGVWKQSRWFQPCLFLHPFLHCMVFNILPGCLCSLLKPAACRDLSSRNILGCFKKVNVFSPPLSNFRHHEPWYN